MMSQYHQGNQVDLKSVISNSVGKVNEMINDCGGSDLKFRNSSREATLEKKNAGRQTKQPSITV